MVGTPPQASVEGGKCKGGNVAGSLGRIRGAALEMVSGRRGESVGRANWPVLRGACATLAPQLSFGCANGHQRARTRSRQTCAICAWCARGSHCAFISRVHLKQQEAPLASFGPCGLHLADLQANKRVLISGQSTGSANRASLPLGLAPRAKWAPQSLPASSGPKMGRN